MNEQHGSGSTRERILKLAVAGVCLTAVAFTTGCRSETVAPFDPPKLQENELSRAPENQTREKRPLPTTLESPYLLREGGGRQKVPERDGGANPPTTGPSTYYEGEIRMPLSEIIQRAVASNLDVKVAAYGPAIEQSRVIEEEAQFDPRFFAQTTFQHQDRWSPSQGGTLFPNDNGIYEDERDIFSAATGIRQNLMTGGQAELRYEASRTRTDLDQFQPDPFYESDLILEITQPILRNFGGQVNRARIEVQKLNQQVSLLDLRKSIEDNVLKIEQTYWQLVQAVRNVQIIEDLLRQTQDTADVIFLRERQDASKVQTAQAAASVEQRRAALIRAKAQVRDLSDQLKQLMNDPDFPVSSAALIMPANAPVTEAFRFDYDDALKTAMQFRAELAQQQLKVNSADIVVQVAKNNLLPQLNVVTQLGVQGLDDSYGSAIDRQVDFDGFGYSIGLELEIPIGNRTARATERRTINQRNQELMRYRSLLEQVSLDLKIRIREVQTSWDSIIATRQAVFTAAEALRLIEVKQESGEALTPTFVQLKLDRQAALASAQQQEAEAVAAYNIAIAQVERAKGTLLRYNNIMMAQEQAIQSVDQRSSLEQ